MSVNAFASTTIRLPLKTAEAIIHQCEREFLLPRQVIARNFGEPIGEPVILKIPDQDRWYLPGYKDFPALQKREAVSRPWGEQKKVYLSVLSQIAKAMPGKFAEYAPSLHGTKRVYFGRSRAEVEHTGKGNEAAKIPETDWWASVNKEGYKKQKTLADLMGLLGFSADYTALISWAPCHKFPVLPGIQFKSD
jgi:hypothetical protein